MSSATSRHAGLSSQPGMRHPAHLAQPDGQARLSRSDGVRFGSFEDNFEPVKAAAQSLKELLERLGLPAYLKTTGSRGLHVAVPLKRQADFDSVRAFARELAEVVVRQEPGSAHWNNEKASVAATCSWTPTGTPTHKRWPLLTPCAHGVALRYRSRSHWSELNKKELRPMA